MELKEKGRNAIKWSLIEKFFKRGITFVISIFLARLLDPSDFGLVAICSFFTAFAEVLNSFGLGQAIVQRNDVDNIQLNTVFYINFVLSVVMVSVLWFSAPFISDFYGNPLVTDIIRVLSLGFIFSAFDMVNRSLLNKHLRFSVFAKAMLISSASSGTIAVFLAFGGAGVWSLVLYGLSASFINTICIMIMSDWRPGLQFRLKSMNKLWKTGVGFLNIGIINNVIDRVDTLFIGKIFNESMLGFYNRAKSLQELPQYTLILPVTRPMFPIFSQIQNDKQQFYNTFKVTVSMLFFLVMLIFGLLLLNADNLIIIVYSSKWTESIPFFQILLFLLPILPLNVMTTSMLKGVGRLRLLTLITVLDRFSVFIALPFGYYLGLKEYAVVFVFCKYLVFFIRIYLLQKKVGLKAFVIFYILSKISLVFLVSFVPILIFISISNIYLDTIVNTIVFTTVFFGLSHVLKIKGYQYFMAEIMGLIKAVFKKLK